MTKAISKKLPYKFRYEYSEKLHKLTKERNYFRNLFLRTGYMNFRTEMNRLNCQIKAETRIINKMSFNDKIGALDKRDSTLSICKIF